MPKPRRQVAFSCPGPTRTRTYNEMGIGNSTLLFEFLLPVVRNVFVVMIAVEFEKLLHNLTTSHVQHVLALQELLDNLPHGFMEAIIVLNDLEVLFLHNAKEFQ